MLSLLHRAWRGIPAKVRRPLFYAGTRLLAPKPPSLSAIKPGAVTIAGLLGTVSGIGQGARLIYAGCNALGLETRCHDLSAAFKQKNFTFDGTPDAAVAGGAILVHVHGPYLPFALQTIGRSGLQNRLRIAYWPWDLPLIPADWHPALNLVHEIWAPSTFSADAIRPFAKVPVRVVHYPLTIERDLIPGPALPEDGRPFTVICISDMAAAFYRKNPIAAVHAFRAAFSDDRGAQLILKIHNAEHAPQPFAELQKAIGSASNIILHREKLDRAALLALMRQSDAVLSLHRSEGFGLVLAEAMLLGKPVIATNWSANVDFMNENNSAPIGYRLIPVHDPQGNYPYPDQHWAEPDNDHAAEWLRRLRNDTALRLRLSEAGLRDATQAFGLKAFRAAVGQRFLDVVSATSGF